MTLQETIKEKITHAAQEFTDSLPALNFSVEVPESAEHGDYATNVALMLAKSLGRRPIEIAEELVKKLQDERWEVSVAKPGFLNFALKDNFLLHELKGVDDDWGESNEGKGKTVMVEYFQLNIAKRPHIGHLRSAVIGDALKRIFLSQGYCAISDTHVGDWGTQFGILLLACKELGIENVKRQIGGDPFRVLEDLYQKENRRIEENPDRREAAKREFANLERGDEGSRELWRWMVTISMKKLEESAERLGLLSFDEHKGESSYESDMPAIVEGALQKGVAIKKEDGAVVVDLTAEKLDEAVLIKADGASTYLLRDLATIAYRREKRNFWRNLYVVDTRQSHHFRQLFRAAELLSFEGVGESEHVEFGFMKFPEGAISTRKGTVIALDTLLDEAEKRAREVIREKNPELKNAEEIAKTVGIGAVKYFDLSHNRKSDIIFEWDKVLSFEGNTGPYLQYTHARLKSILRNNLEAELPSESVASTRPTVAGRDSAVLEDVEHKLLSSILRFPEAISDTLSLLSPHVLAHYVYSLASAANEFYHALPVLREQDGRKRAVRIVLVAAAATTLKNGLNLLGIETPEEM